MTDDPAGGAATMRPLLVLVTGDPIDGARHHRGRFFEWIRDASRVAWSGSWLEVDVRTTTDLPRPDAVAGVIITGSAARIADQDEWLKRTVGYTRHLVQAGVPTLGICFGHQVLGEALGGRVTANPQGREIGTVDLEIFGACPLIEVSPRTDVAVNMTHLDSVVTLPPGANVVARTALEPHAVVEFSEACWGVQFHPEIDGEIMRFYIEGRREAMASEGLDAASLYDTARDTPLGASVLPRFIERFVGSVGDSTSPRS